MEKKKSLSQYEEPKITTYTSEDILEAVGPLQAISNDIDKIGGTGLMER